MSSSLEYARQRASVVITSVLDDMRHQEGGILLSQFVMDHPVEDIQQLIPDAWRLSNKIANGLYAGVMVAAVTRQQNMNINVGLLRSRIANGVEVFVPTMIMRSAFVHSRSLEELKSQSRDNLVEAYSLQVMLKQRGMKRGVMQNPGRHYVRAWKSVPYDFVNLETVLGRDIGSV